MKAFQGFTEDGYGPVEEEMDPCDGCTCPSCDSCPQYDGAVGWNNSPSREESE